MTSLSQKGRAPAFGTKKPFSEARLVPVSGEGFYLWAKGETFQDSVQAGMVLRQRGGLAEAL
jgi:hypothetical protein